MARIPKQYIEKEVNGEIFGTINPEYEKYVQSNRYKHYLKLSNIPKEYYDLDFDNYIGTKSINQVNACKQYAQQCRSDKFKDTSIFITGENSSQKTMIMCAIGKEFIRQGYSVKYILSGDLINKLMKLQGFSYNEEINREIEELKYVDLLLADEMFDKYKALMWSSENKSMIVSAYDLFFRERIANQRRNIFGSNIEFPKIGNDYSVSIYKLLDRNCEKYTFMDNIELARKKRLRN